MRTQLSQKLAALGMALVLHGAIAGGIAYLFSTGAAHADAMRYLARV